jgi:probable F420-dependent oxidoreductase
MCLVRRPRQDVGMTDREFRFGVVAGRAPTGAAWTAMARRAEDLGYDTLLVPDTRGTLSPFPALAAAAAATSTLHVGTYVLSVPNRTPGLVAWESETLQTLSGGRFELGLGGGRPDAERDAAALGADFGTPGDRLARVAGIVDAVRALGQPPRILIAASRPRMLRLAAERADTVALGLPPATTEAELGRTVETLRAAAGDRAAELELHLNTAAVVADPADLPEQLSRMVGGDPRAMAESGAISMLVGSPERIADVLRHRREQFGVTYLGVNSQYLEAFAEVIAQLRA